MLLRACWKTWDRLEKWNVLSCHMTKKLFSSKIPNNHFVNEIRAILILVTNVRAKMIWWHQKFYIHIENRLQSCWWQRYICDFMMVTVLSCCWLFQCKESVTNMLNRSQRSQSCHQHKPSPAFVTNINVARKSLSPADQMDILLELSMFFAVFRSFFVFGVYYQMNFNFWNCDFPPLTMRLPGLYNSK